MTKRTLSNALKASLALGVVFISGISASVHAELIATPVIGDSRLVTFNFDEDNTYLVLSKPKTVTHLQFAPDEVIKSVAAGDTDIAGRRIRVL